MQDEAPPHWHRDVRQWLNNFEGRWMERGSQNLPRAPYSPDLTPCDFFLWGYVKSKVYRTKQVDLEELKGRIQQAFDEMPQKMIDRAMESYRRRLERCIQVNGKSVEQKYAN
uniref:Transposase n=1 Tax=Acrobeloides nanus TaxID=290746 RepID=A0A914CWJ9_9BILA